MRTGRAVLAALLVCACAPAWSPQAAIAAGGETRSDEVLPGCGICYPGGYDPNTVGDVAGKVSDIVIPDKGPVRFVVTGDDERWTVLAAPAWFWKMADPQFAPGDTVTVHGSKSLGADGKLYIVAQTVERAGRTAPPVMLRDGRGTPLWQGSHGGGGMRGGAGSTHGPGAGQGRGGGSGRR